MKGDCSFNWNVSRPEYEKCISFPDFIQQHIVNDTNSTEETIAAEIKTFILESQAVLSILANILALLITIRSAFESADLTKHEKPKYPMFCCFLNWNIKIRKPTLLDIKGQDVLVDDHPEVTYSYWAFHLIYACACQYIMMTTTGWLNAFRFESMEDR